MKTFLELSLQRKEHEKNRVALHKVLRDKEIVSIDYGLENNTSRFSVEVWNQKGTHTLDEISFEVNKGVVTRYDTKITQKAAKQIYSVLENNTEEAYFGVESFNWDDGSGYIYPANGGYGNIAVYMNREELEYYLTLPTTK